MPTKDAQIVLISLLFITSMALIQAINSTFFIYINQKLALY